MKIKWTKTFDGDQCRCYEPNVKGVDCIWWYSWKGCFPYEVRIGEKKRTFRTLQEAKKYICKEVA